MGKMKEKIFHCSLHPLTTDKAPLKILDANKQLASKSKPSFVSLRRWIKLKPREENLCNFHSETNAVILHKGKLSKVYKALSIRGWRRREWCNSIATMVEGDDADVMSQDLIDWHIFLNIYLRVENLNQNRFSWSQIVSIFRKSPHNPHLALFKLYKRIKHLSKAKTQLHTMLNIWNKHKVKLFRLHFLCFTVFLPFAYLQIFTFQRIKRKLHHSFYSILSSRNIWFMFCDIA